MSELTLKQMILNKIDDAPHGFAKELAAIAGYSSGGNLNKVLKDEKREFDKLQGLIDLVKYLWKDKYLDLVSQYSNEVDPNKKTARGLLEFLSTNRLIESFRKLLDKMHQCNNKESQEWAKIYEILYESQTTYETMNSEDMLRKVKRVKVYSLETSVFKNILITNYYHHKGDFHMTKSLSEEIEYDIELIEDSYIKSMYSARLGETMSYINLRVFNNPDEARKHANLVLDSNIGRAFKAYANFVIGYSYLFTSFENTVKYLTESMDYYRGMNREKVAEDLEEKIELAQVLWGKIDGLKCKYIKNKLLFDVIEDKKILSLDDYSAKVDEPFLLYLKGFHSKNEHLLLESVICYLNKGDSFLANFPKLQLLKMGYSESLLNRLVNIRVA